ncbi:MAG: winged helix-turn-helix domain-containing protein [Actinomycetota bacterium]
MSDNGDVWRFDRVAVDPAARSVELDGEARHLEPQAFDLLVYLVEHRDRFVPKAELLDQVWGDQFVSESALTTRVKEVRRAVGDDGTRQAVIRNARGRGYRFVAELSAAEPPARREQIALTSALIGRDDDTTDVLELLDRSAIVTLVGPGGAGKTSLAREVARRARGRYADGVRTVHLATIDEPGDVVPVLRSGAGLDGAERGEAGVLTALAELDALVVVDNCEHVIDETARLLALLADHTPRVRILATSRERLGIRPERVWPVGPLDAAAARRLIVERVTAIAPDWEPEPDETLDQLAEVVDRLPLALEMAASRLPSLGAEELIGLLGERLDLLRTTDRAAEERHRTLGALIEWSTQLLEPEPRSLLADLTVFAGAVGAEDIAAVVDTTAAELVAGPLGDLVDRSLVVADLSAQPTRYRLFETVKAGVVDRRRPDLEERHARYVTDEVESADRLLRGAEEPIARHRLDALRNEIRAAHRWARLHDRELSARLSAALLHYAQERLWAEPARWAAAALDVEHPAPAHAAAVANDSANRGDYDESLRLGELALTSGDPRIVASGHDSIANVGLYRGDLALAEEHARQLLARSLDDGDPVAWMLAQANVVLSLVYGGRLDEARVVFETGSPPTDLNVTGRAWMAYVAGELAIADDPRAAVARFDEAAALGRSVGSSFVVGVSETSGLAARARLDDTADAFDRFAAVLAGFRRSGSHTHAVTALRNLVLLLVRSGNDQLAAELFGALSGPGVKSTYGVELEQLTDARAELVDRHGDEQVDRWQAGGSSHGVRWALDHAISTLNDIEAGRSAAS